MRRTVCLVCGGPVVHDNLYCSAKCGEGRLSHSATREALDKRGFKVDNETPNIYLKDGVALTLEHVNHVGLDKAIIQHDAAVAIRARSGLS
jgi:hypothetical protein